MDDRIYIKENKPTRNLVPIIIGVLALILVLVGLIGIISTLSSGNGTPNSAPITDEDDTDTTPTATATPTPTEVEEPTTSPTPTEEETGEPGEGYAPPADASKIHIYFVATSGYKEGFLKPVLRDKPSENILWFITNEVVVGPKSTDSGVTSAWSFTGTSNCGAGKTYAFNVTGSTLNVNLCREITGNIDAFIEALQVSQGEATSIKSVKLKLEDGSCRSSNDDSLC